MLASPHLNQRLMEHLNTGVVLLDADLSIIFMNPAAEALLEVSGQRGRGVEFTMLARESDEATQAFRDALINGHSYTKREATIELHNQQLQEQLLS